MCVKDTTVIELGESRPRCLNFVEKIKDTLGSKYRKRLHNRQFSIQISNGPTKHVTTKIISMQDTSQVYALFVQCWSCFQAIASLYTKKF